MAAYATKIEVVCIGFRNERYWSELAAPFGVITDTDPRKLVFRIEYETIDETSLHVGKLSQIKHPNNKLYDGQTSQTVDLEKQTLHEYFKANRLGNKL